MLPDFRKFVLEATHWNEALSVQNLNWSAARHSLFGKCPRAYFIRYFLAQGGWEAFSSAISRRAFAEKYLLSFDDWIVRILERSFEHAVLETLRYRKHLRGAALKEQMQLAASREIYYAEPVLRAEDFQRDPKQLCLMESYYHRPDFSGVQEILDLARKMLKYSFAGMESEGFYEKVLEIDPMSWRLPGQFLSYRTSGGILVELRKWLYAYDRGRIFAFRFHFHRNPAEGSSFETEDVLKAEQVFRAWAERKYPVSEVCFCNFIQVGHEVSLNEADGSFYPVLQDSEVEDSARLIRSFLLKKEKLTLDDFPVCEEEERCASCRFFGTCSFLKN